LVPGSTGASPVAVGALADCCRAFKKEPRRCRDVVGGGADHDTRGAYAPQSAVIKTNKLLGDVPIVFRIGQIRGGGPKVNADSACC